MRTPLTEIRKSKGHRQLFLIFAFCLLPFAFLSSGCRQDMHDNPKYKPYREGANRQVPDGALARGSLDMNPAAPKVGQAAAPPAPAGSATSPSAGAQASPTPAPIPTGEDGFPFKLSGNSEERKAQLKAILDRGENRFNISCLPCHGKLGDGNGMIPQRGFRHPPSYHEERLQKAPSSHFYDVMTNGFGAMPSYADQLTPEDRWKVIAYIRALQLSQRADLAKLAENVKQDVETKIEEAAKKKEEHKNGGHAGGEGEKRASVSLPNSAQSSAQSSGGHSN
jgi:mono/diheme cytochrome c family protein